MYNFENIVVTTYLFLISTDENKKTGQTHLEFIDLQNIKPVIFALFKIKKRF